MNNVKKHVDITFDVVNSNSSLLIDHNFMYICIRFILSYLFIVKICEYKTQPMLVIEMGW